MIETIFNSPSYDSSVTKFEFTLTTNAALYLFKVDIRDGLWTANIQRNDEEIRTMILNDGATYFDVDLVYSVSLFGFNNTNLSSAYIIIKEK